MPRRFSSALALVFAVPLAVVAPSLSGCAGTEPAAPVVDVRSNPYAAFPEPPSLDPVATPPEPRPVTARITERTTVDTRVFLVLDRLTTAVERKNWRAVALFMDEEGFEAQMRFLTGGGLSPERAAADALAGALGLIEAESAIFPAAVDREAAPFRGLDRIQTMTVQTIAQDPLSGQWRASGYVRIDDRETHEFALVVVGTEHGLRMVVPQG